MKHGYSKVYNTEDDEMTIDILHEIAKKYPDYRLYISVKNPVTSNPNDNIWINKYYSVLDIYIGTSVNDGRKIIISNMSKRECDLNQDILVSFIQDDLSSVKIITASDLSSFIKKNGKNDKSNKDEIDVVIYTTVEDSDDINVNYKFFTIDEIYVDEDNENIILRVF